MNIFVAKLSPSTTSEGLQDLFQQFGQVTSAKIIMDRETGMSKGYGFVEMSDDAEARAAIEELNDSEVDGHAIVVKESQPSGGGKPSFGNKPRPRPFGNNNNAGGSGQRFNKKPGGFSGGNGGGSYRDRGSNFSRDKY